MFLDYLEQHLGEPRFNSSGLEAQWDCPFCEMRGETPDTRKRFRMHIHKLVGYCFNCGWSGNAVQFVRDYQRVNWYEAFDVVNFYEDFRPLPQDVFEEVFDKLYLEGVDLDENKKYIKLPEDFKTLYNTKSLQAKRFWEYARKRHLTDKQVKKHGVGFCPEGVVVLENKKEVRLNNHLIVQTFDDNNKPLYWMGRAIIDGIKPKAFNPVGKSNTINKSDVIFNLNNAKKTGVAVITEGVFDATTIGESGVALFGKTMSVRQMIQIIKADLEAVYIMLDPDALREALKIADMLNKHMSDVYLCILKEGDPNSIGRKGCLELIKNAEKYNKLSALKYQLR